MVPVTNSIHRMPAIAPGSAVRMMNGSSHDWKFTRHQQIYQNHGEDHAQSQAEER